jgi:phage-related protein
VMIKIWQANGQVVDTTKFGLVGLQLVIPSPSYEAEREKLPGVPGVVTLDKQLQPRPLTAKYWVKSRDYLDSMLLRDELYKLFSAGNTFFIGEEKQPGKRWLVECTEQWTPERVNNRTMRTEIPLMATKGFAESIGTTLEPKTFDLQKWQTGQGLILDETMYTHSTSTFKIYNAADGLTIDPRKIPLLITYKGASTNLQIKNLTTGDTWQYNAATIATDKLELKGTRSLKNGAVNIFKDTNRKLISLAPGWNDFQLIGTSGSFTISFDFRFYTL